MRGAPLRSPPVAAKRPQQRSRAFARRARSLLPVSPLPSSWSPWVARGALAALALLLVGGVIALIALLGDDETEPKGDGGPVASAPVKRKLEGLSLSQKVDAVVISGFDDSDQAARLARDVQLGGILVGAQNWFGTFKGRTLISRIHAQAERGGRVEPFVVGLQEGGAYRAYPDLPPVEGQIQVGATADPKSAVLWSEATATALAKSGFDLNLAPIADVATLDSPIADRAFGDDPTLVAAMTAGSVRGCRITALVCALPYFPGLGAASQSTDVGPATVSLDEASLEARDLVPFRAAIAAGAPALVLSLGLYAAYDPITPAALSSPIATDLLRERLGFKGIAITDDLSAGSAATGMPARRAAIQALAAGADMIQVSDPAEAAAARRSLTAAAREGSIPAERLDQAVARVLSLKRKLGLL